MLSSLCFSVALSAYFAAPPEAAAGWKPHPIRVGDGKGGWTYMPGEFQFLQQTGLTQEGMPLNGYVFPFGLARMADGEIALIASWKASEVEKPVITFSQDEGESWCPWQVIEEVPAPEKAADNRPVGLAWLGGKELCFIAHKTRYFSKDGGRTWPETAPVPPVPSGGMWYAEGNPLVEFDEDGNFVRMGELGWNWGSGPAWPKGALDQYIRWSTEGGRTWGDALKPEAWHYTVEHQGESYPQGMNEGSLARAENGWLVAALRSHLHPRYWVGTDEFDDGLEGMGVSISKDDGTAWSEPEILFESGRHHPSLHRLPNGHLVMSYVVRNDMAGGKRASCRRGCEAMVSTDNGVTWDRSRRYILDEFEFEDGMKWWNGWTGHVASITLADGRVITAYGRYLSRGAALIRWKPRGK